MQNKFLTFRSFLTQKKFKQLPFWVMNNFSKAMKTMMITAQHVDRVCRPMEHDPSAVLALKNQQHNLLEVSLSLHDSHVA
jgi:hypothetical protein